MCSNSANADCGLWEFRPKFLHIQDRRIHQKVEENSRQTAVPEPLIQLNPSFEPGHGLTSWSMIAPCTRMPPIFRKEKQRMEGSGQGKPLRLHKHQTDAIKVARTGHNYVLTTARARQESGLHYPNRGLRPAMGPAAVSSHRRVPDERARNSQEASWKSSCVMTIKWERPVTFARYTG